MPKNYSIKNVTTPLPSKAEEARAQRNDDIASASNDGVRSEFARAEAEDDDGYDPYSDRPPAPEATFQEDPWR